MRRAAAAALLAGAASLAATVAAAVWLARTPAPPLAPAQDLSMLVLDARGRLLRPFTASDGRWRLPVSADAVDPRYLRMLKAYEDRRFDSHPGADPLALGRAAVQALGHGRVISGGSTLTMQVVRRLSGANERSLARKLTEIGAALALERAVGKEGVLDLYLRLAPYGGNLEGVRAASLAYFGKEPAHLSIGEAALLVALPQSPETRRPDRAPAAARTARDRVLVRLAAQGAVSPEERDRALAEPVPARRLAFPQFAAHAAETARARHPRESEIRLSIDRRLQESLEALARERAEALGPGHSVAILVVDHRDGQVRAHVGSAGYLDLTRAGHVDQVFAVRSPGSALKPFIYGLAFEDGIATPDTLIEDRPTRFGAYAPQNFDQAYHGTVTARRALQQSLNVPAVALLDAIGPHRFAARLREAGAPLRLPAGEMPGLAVGLGGAGTTLADLAGLYAALARGGGAIPLSWAPDSGAPTTETRLLDPVAAWQVASALAGTPPPLNALAGRIAYKTGTSYGYRDAWSVGFDGRHVVAVWAGRPDGASSPGLAGREAAAPILFDAFARLGGRPEPLPGTPPGAALATLDLPPALRRFQPRGQAVPHLAAGETPLTVAFPPDGARIEREAAGEPLALKAAGGAAPFTWLIDGRPIGTPERRRETSWLPQGPGFVRVTVLDSGGRSAAATVRIE